MDNDTFTSNVLVVSLIIYPKLIQPDAILYLNLIKILFYHQRQKFTIIPVPNMNDSKFNYDSKFLLKTNEGFLQKN